MMWKAACDTSLETYDTSAATTNHRHACVQRNLFVDKGPIATDTSPSCSCTTIWLTAKRKRSIKPMEAFKSLKTYQYFADGLVTNVWTHHLQREDSSLVIVNGYFQSLAVQAALKRALNTA